VAGARLAARLFRLAAGCAVIGFHLAFVVYPLLFGYIYGARLRNSAYISVSGLLLVFLIFDYFVGAVWQNPIDDAIGDGMLAVLNAILEPFRR
jgi:hypothetical protein